MGVSPFHAAELDLDLDRDLDRDQERGRDRERELSLMLLLMVVLLRVGQVMVGLKVGRLISLVRVEKLRVLGKLGMV